MPDISSCLLSEHNAGLHFLCSSTLSGAEWLILAHKGSGSYAHLFLLWVPDPLELFLTKFEEALTLNPDSTIRSYGVSPHNDMKMRLWFHNVKSLWLHVQLFGTPWVGDCQAPPSMGFSRHEYWNGSPFPSPGDLPDPGIEPGSPTLQADSLPSEPPGKLSHFISQSHLEDACDTKITLSVLTDNLPVIIWNPTQVTCRTAINST